MKIVNILNLLSASLLLIGIGVVMKKHQNLEKQQEYLDKQMPSDIIASNQEKIDEYHSVHKRIDSVYSQLFRMEGLIKGLSRVEGFAGQPTAVTVVKYDTIYIERTGSDDLPSFICSCCKKMVTYSSKDVGTKWDKQGRFVKCPYCLKVKKLEE